PVWLSKHVVAPMRDAFRMSEKTRGDPGADHLLCVALRDVATGMWPLRVVWLVVVPINLLEEGLGVECVGGIGDAGDDRKRNEGGQDGLHDHSPLTELIGCGFCVRRPIRSDCGQPDRKSTRLNSSHTVISYAVFFF